MAHFQGSFKNADPAAGGKPGDEERPLTDPSLAAVRQLLMEQVVLPLCSENVAASAPYPQTLLLYGPQQGGKSMLIDALAAECGANVFELGHRNTDGKYEKKKAAMMMHMVFKVAKALAPSIIKFDEAELTWISDKKKVKAMGFGEPGARILKDMAKEMKDLSASDRVVLIGESKQPWLCEKGDQKKFLSFFKMMVYVPICDYGSLQYAYPSLLAQPLPSSVHP
jgi:SpoVK/Ycf46/Vps4 family AAA+-type ATPase